MNTLDQVRKRGGSKESDLIKLEGLVGMTFRQIAYIYSKLSNSQAGGATTQRITLCGSDKRASYRVYMDKDGERYIKTKAAPKLYLSAMRGKYRYVENN